MYTICVIFLYLFFCHNQIENFIFIIKYKKDDRKMTKNFKLFGNQTTWNSRSFVYELSVQNFIT